MTLAAWSGVVSSVWADGGRIRFADVIGPYQITVFTSPTPFRAGPVDVSVFVQDRESGKVVHDIEVTVRASQGDERIEQPATTQAATNKLYRAALFDLPAPGVWKVQVEVMSSRSSSKVRAEFMLVADAPLPRWQAIWPWLAWPLVPIIVFGFREHVRRGKKLP